MQFVPLFTLLEGVFAAAAVVAVILFLWFLARLSHRPYMVVRDQSDGDRVVAIQLGRIADSIDRLARSVEARARVNEAPAVAPAEEKTHGMSLSMFGR